MEEKLVTLKPQGYIHTWNSDILRALNEVGIVFHRLDNSKTECGPKYLLYSIDGELKKPKAKKYCRDCIHLNIERIVMDKNGNVLGRGVCYNNGDHKLVCELSRQGCANYEPIEEESEE